MTLDPETRSELVKARKSIIAQLDGLEFRVTDSMGCWRRRGPEDAGDVYDALKEEVLQIDELLGPKSTDE